MALPLSAALPFVVYSGFVDDDVLPYNWLYGAWRVIFSDDGVVNCVSGGL